MKILGVDTATESASVALLADENLVAEARSRDHCSATPAPTGPGNHAQTLIPLIDQVLHRASATLDQIEAIAVSIGPGSFTGLRVGLSVVKGLAYRGNVVVVGVPTLAAIAERVREWPDLICPILDARKKEVYAALFQGGSQALQRLCADAAEPIEATIQKVLTHAARRKCLFVGDGVIVYGGAVQSALGDQAVLGSEDPNVSTAAAVARLGAQRLRTSGPDALESLAPWYVRASEVEFSR